MVSHRNMPNSFVVSVGTGKMLEKCGRNFAWVLDPARRCVLFERRIAIVDLTLCKSRRLELQYQDFVQDALTEYLLQLSCEGYECQRARSSRKYTVNPGFHQSWLRNPVQGIVPWYWVVVSWGSTSNYVTLFLITTGGRLCLSLMYIWRNDEKYTFSISQYRK